jgi:hypothetical protein
VEQESKQAEATVEQPKEEISKEIPQVTPPEEKKTSERTYSETEWRKMQGNKDTADAKAQKLEKENLALRGQQEQQRLEARQKEIADLGGDTDGLASAKRKHQLEDDVAKLEQEKTESEGAVQRKYDQSIELATEHNLSLADARELMKAGSPREMELMAQLKVAEKAKVQEESPPKEETGYKPDSGTSDAGGDSDKAFQARWNTGEEPATKENQARIKKILAKA